MAVVATGEMTVNPDLSGFESKATSAFGGIAKKAALAFGGVFAASKAKDFFADAIGGASDLQESLGKVGVVFGPAAAGIEKFASNSAKALGQSKQQALEAAGTFGNLAVSLGLPQKQSAEMSKSLVTLGADLASFNNTSVDDALNALRSGLTGETEPLKRFGIALDDATLRQKALELGLVKSTKEVLPPAIKAQASYALIMERSKTAQGDFARTSGGLANQQRIFGAQITDLKTRIGTALLPIMSKITAFMVGNMGPAFEGLGKLFKRVTKFLEPLKNMFANFIGAFTGEGTEFVGDFDKAFYDLGTTIKDLFNNQIKPFAKFLVDKVLPVFVDTGKAVAKFAGFLLENIDAVKKVAAVIATVLLPHYIKLGIEATVSAAKQVAAWVLTKVEAIKAAVVSSAQFVIMIAKWVALGVAAAANAAIIAASWLIALGPVALVVAAMAGVAIAIVANWDTIKKAFAEGAKFVVDKFLGLVELVIKGAATAFGWIPGIGPKLKEAAKAFEGFRDDVNRSLDGMKGEKVIYVKLKGGDPRISVTDAGAGAPQDSRVLISDAAPIRGRRASGGMVSPYASYLVGERGPEILRMGSRGGEVIPNGASSPVVGQMIIQGATFQGADATAVSVVRELRAEAYRQGK